MTPSEVISAAARYAMDCCDPQEDGDWEEFLKIARCKADEVDEAIKVVAESSGAAKERAQRALFDAQLSYATAALIALGNCPYTSQIEYQPIDGEMALQ
jgi:hypothetical protein